MSKKNKKKITREERARAYGEAAGRAFARAVAGELRKLAGEEAPCSCGGCGSAPCKPEDALPESFGDIRQPPVTATDILKARAELF